MMSVSYFLSSKSVPVHGRTTYLENIYFSYQKDDFQKSKLLSNSSNYTQRNPLHFLNKRFHDIKMRKLFP